jgi:hypothetical protein
LLSVEAEGGSGDPRPAILAACLLLLAGVVGVILFTGGSSADLGKPPPARCVSLWNSDRQARRYGRHNFASHRYAGAQVLFLDREGNPARGGNCAVVFPAASLDPEPVAAAQAYVEDGWVPLSRLEGVTDQRLAQLQAEAIPRNNVILLEDGTLEPFS